MYSHWLVDEDHGHAPRPLASDPVALAHKWHTAYGDVERTQRRLIAADEAVEGSWWWNRRRLAHEARERTGYHRRALAELLRAGDHLERNAVGSTQNWSALSRVNARQGALSLEETLRRLANDLPKGWAKSTLASLPAIRANTALGAPTDVDHLHTQILSVARDLRTEVAVDLYEHIPGPLRPLPETVEALERRTPFRTLSVSLPMEDARWELLADGAPRRIRLHDIVVEQRGRGLGTAVLEHLCAFADEHEYIITGQLEPGPGKPDADAVRLAAWYARHGFRQGGSPPSQWRRGAYMSRAPRQVQNPS
ncbi:GNAT family N-acetyltransferase [Knoellia sp. S7-12]|uniref:GNAT family N-acetyltransferase n=1 Tax=Knoellia sp. S7-12 TaxID=3126698 RepID=UPI0033681AFF